MEEDRKRKRRMAGVGRKVGVVGVAAATAATAVGLVVGGSVRRAVVAAEAATAGA